VSAWEPSSGATDEWYTPSSVFEALGCSFDLDVAAPKEGPLHTPSLAWFADSALERDWFGFVWMNPPFGGRNQLSPWLRKLFDHGDGVALTPDRTSTAWFREAWARTELVLFIPKVKFIRSDGTIGLSPSSGTALWASGQRGEEALRHAASVGAGILAKPQ
jgi:hypothetical protein